MKREHHFQTPAVKEIEKAKPTSLEDSLIEKYTAELKEAERLKAEAGWNLGRVAMLYNQQLTLNMDYDAREL